MKNKPAEITQLLEEIGTGNRRALDDLLPQVYRELKHIAKNHLGRERADHTLQPTALIHEVFLRLVEAARLQFNDRAHFFAAASQMMRRILVNHARAKHRLKRGGADVKVTFNEALGAGPQSDLPQLLALDEALEKLKAENERHAEIVVLRFFGGLTVEEVAEVMNVSVATVKRDWAFAKTWLYRELDKKEK